MTSSEASLPAKEKKRYPSRCTQCGGRVEAGITALAYGDEEGGFSLVVGVPAGLCQASGEKYLTLDTARKIEALLATFLAAAAELTSATAPRSTS